MQLEDHLARSLRMLCASKPSVAHVCRQTGIHRQQFERYLTGDAIPNRATRAKICSYFRISEAELFGLAASEHASGKASWSEFSNAALRYVRNTPPPSLRSGLYLLYFSLAKQNGVVCSLLMIKNDGRDVTFRRVTKLDPSRQSIWGRYRGDHRGVVLERLKTLFLAGFNSDALQEPSLLAVEWVPYTQPVLRGHSLIMSPSGAQTLSVAIISANSGTTLRGALRKLGFFTLDDSRLDPLVKMLFTERLDLV